MGWFKKAFKSIGKTVKKVANYNPMISQFTGGKGGGDSRSEAAGKLVKKDTQKQGGSGQVKFKTEVYE